MKLDKDGSGSIDKEEFLQIPQIANNPLASRMIAIFDEEWVHSQGAAQDRPDQATLITVTHHSLLYLAIRTAGAGR